MRTVVEATLGIVRWALGVPAQILPLDFDVVRIQLIPDHYLLRSLYTLGFIVFAPDRRLWGSDRLGRRRVSNDFALVGEHGHVWLTTAVGDL